VKLRLGALARVKPEDVPDAVAHAIEHVDASIRAMRSLITDMRPASLDHLGVGPALEALAERWSMQTGIDTNLDVDLRFETGDEPTRLTPLIETTIYRVVQEALTNVAKHAGAQRVSVTVVERDGAVEIAVTDDGSGFSGEGPTDGLGLIGLRERARLAGGRHDIESRPGEGTTVHAWIPASRLDPAPAAQAGSN